MIPRQLHFIWIELRPFGKGEYMSLLSALMNTPYQCFLHTDMSGESEYNPVKLQEAYPDRLVIQPTTFQQPPGLTVRAATLSDIYRIKILHENGGIYSDLDILWKKPLPEELFNEKLVCFYENPSYKTVNNAVILVEPGYEFSALEFAFRAIFERHIKLGKLDLTDKKYHTLLWKATGDFMKKHNAKLMGKKFFYKNGWRRIGRCLRDAGLPHGLAESLIASKKKDVLSFDDICGFHYYNGLFSIENVLQLDAVKKEFVELIAATP